MSNFVFQATLVMEADLETSPLKGEGAVLIFLALAFFIFSKPTPGFPQPGGQCVCAGEQMVGFPNDCAERSKGSCDAKKCKCIQRDIYSGPQQGFLVTECSCGWISEATPTPTPTPTGSAAPRATRIPRQPKPRKTPTPALVELRICGGRCAAPRGGHVIAKCPTEISKDRQCREYFCTTIDAEERFGFAPCS